MTAQVAAPSELLQNASARRNYSVAPTQAGKQAMGFASQGLIGPRAQTRKRVEVFFCHFPVSILYSIVWGLPVLHARRVLGACGRIVRWIDAQDCAAARIVVIRARLPYSVHMAAPVHGDGRAGTPSSTAPLVAITSR